jgi:hypothetical protein
MDCMHCSHPPCTLAGGRPPRGGGGVSVSHNSPFTCGMNNCHGRMSVRSTTTNVFFLGCDRHEAGVAGSCDHVIWLPKYVTGVAVAPAESVSSRCTTCSRANDAVLLLDFAFVHGSVAAHMSSVPIRKVGNTTYTFRTCIVCQRGEVDGVKEKPFAITTSMRHARANLAIENAAAIHSEIADLEDIASLLFDAPIEKSAAPAFADGLGGKFLQPENTLRLPRKAGAVKTAARSSIPVDFAADAPVAPYKVPSSELLVRKPAKCPLHNKELILRTAGPKSRRPGARFWVCPDKAAGGCDSFQWEDEGVPTSATATNAGGHDGECYNCGKRGHFSANCPTKMSGDVLSSADRKRSITPSGAGQSRDCYKCGKLGHFSANCPTNMAAESTSAGQKRPRPASSADVDDDKQSRLRRCGLCKQVGHTKPKCPHNVEARWNAVHDPAAFL